MGFLHESEPMTWSEVVEGDLLRFVRAHGIEQFRNVFVQCQQIEGDPFRWGDEVEHGIFQLVGDGPEDGDRTVKVVLRSPAILEELKEAEEHLRAMGADADSTATWMPEFGAWMLESTPGKPFDGIEGTALIEQQMRVRRSRLLSVLRPGEVAPTVTFMPLFGTADFCEPPYKPGGSAAESLFVPDEVIFPHARFPTLTRNIRNRRGGKVAIRRPLMVDEQTHTPSQADWTVVPTSVAEADSLDHVYADAMPFGMGCCCLQVTMQASSLEESLQLYDQLAPLTPVFLALTAATPFLRGWICDDDARWTQVAQSVDDRTPAERGLNSQESNGDARLAGSGVQPLRKSRYDSVDCYLGGDCHQNSSSQSQCNDVPLVMEQEHLDRLTAVGVPEALARHVAHLFARDPLVIFGDRIHLDDQKDVDHWENLQSTNWQTLRWKPPPVAKGVLDSSDPSHIGWRVEFRSMEVQLTDFENAAFVAAIVLLSKTILARNLDLRIPISKIEENMETAARRKAASQAKFWFRTDIGSQSRSDVPLEEVPCALMSLSEILRGNEQFPGLLPLCSKYLTEHEADVKVRSTLERYMDFISRRADGTLATTASWMRSFVLEHPSYKRDSRVPAAAAYDLMVAAAEIGEGRRACPKILGDIVIPLLEPRMNLMDRCSACGYEWESSTSSAGSLEEPALRLQESSSSAESLEESALRLQDMQTLSMVVVA